jgi:hypothetical protein
MSTSTAGPALRVVIAEDAAIMRDGLTQTLTRRGLDVVAIAGTLFISPKVVEKHVASIFDKLGLPPSDTDNRRVIAAIKYLES